MRKALAVCLILAGCATQHDASFSVGTAAPQTGALAMTPSRDIRLICPRPPSCGLTFIVELGNGPFPVSADTFDQHGDPFWQGIDRATGQHYRYVGDNRRYLETATYSDAHVLFHVPRNFGPAQPAHLVLFLHGHDAEIERTLVHEFDLPGQIDRSGANAVLVAPQLARNAEDSTSGKFAEPGRVADFVNEAELVLQRMLRRRDAPFRKAPIILAAYSGGYRTAAQILSHGGLDDRIEGLVLLDAIFGDIGTYATWLDAHRQRAFAYVLYSQASQPETEKLMAELQARGVPYASADDGGPVTGVRFVRVNTPHAMVPVKGPPAEPLAALLRRLTP